MSIGPQTTRAVGVNSFGGPEVLKQIAVALEPLEPDQVRIHVHAAAVSPTDTLLRAGFHARRRPGMVLPVVPGMDVSGTVVECGAQVEGHSIGDLVMGIVLPRGLHGGYRQEIVLPAESVAHIPDSASLVEAATLPMNGLTARLALDNLGLSAGQVLAVTGAAGTFGGYTVQLAKAAGLVVVADAAPADEALVRSLGADVVVSRGPEVAQAIRAVFPDGVDALADGSVQDGQVLSAVRDGGRVASVRGYGGNGGPIQVIATSVPDYARNQAALQRLARHVDAGELTLRVAGTFPVSEAAAAHRLLEAGGLRGKLVLVF